MHFATFFHSSVMNPEDLIEACGDRAIIILDGRETSASHNAIASRECKARGYKGYMLHTGETFCRGVVSSQLVGV